ncbi:hypothetical protein ANO14919_051380 [Xylariales sp. No.14919]|nr:hypothetical protein F5X98DRAFT_326046 [Xylaria grammica]GAW15719.1 hypothetical protein ANO14919_051380 [Xylariales sp. No.14919]
MSPKVDSRASEPTRSAWSRDVRPNTLGVTYSRRSYFYDREFSDSIVRPTDNDPNATQFNRLYESRWRDSTNKGRAALKSTTQLADEGFAGIRARGSPARFVDPFTRGRVLQSAGGDDDDDGVYERHSCAPAHTPTVVAQAVSEPRAAIPNLDVQAIAQGVVFAADLFVRMSEMYQRIRDREGNGEWSENESADELFSLDLDPYHLEAGPPRRSRPNPRVSPQRARHILPARKVTPVQAQEHTAGSSATLTQTRSLLTPLPAGKRICYYLIATVIFGIAASFGIAVWWTQSLGDASAGFTIGGYVIAVDALIIAIVGAVHRPGCRCWKA